MDFSNISGFDWDAGNIHKVSSRVPLEIVEEAFFRDPLVAFDSEHSSRKEKRYLLICLKFKKPVFLVFTMRNNKVRVLTARYMHKREVKKYEKK